MYFGKYQCFGDPYCLEDESSMVLQNASIQPPQYMAQLRKP